MPDACTNVSEFNHTGKFSPSLREYGRCMECGATTVIVGQRVLIGRRLYDESRLRKHNKPAANRKDG